jgi:hypothetical protein
MQIVLTTKAAIFSAAFTCAMLKEVATTYLGYSAEAAEELATKPASKPSKDLAKLDCQKLRTIIVQKLEQSPDYGDAFKTGCLELEYTCLADLDMGNAGANSRRSGGGRKAMGGELKGAYVVVKRGAKCTADSDLQKSLLWDIIWNSATFEQVFAKAAPKYITRTGRIITPNSELRWALKQGWIVPVAA